MNFQKRADHGGLFLRLRLQRCILVEIGAKKMKWLLFLCFFVHCDGGSTG